MDAQKLTDYSKIVVLPRRAISVCVLKELLSPTNTDSNGGRDTTEAALIQGFNVDIRMALSGPSPVPSAVSRWTKEARLLDGVGTQFLLVNVRHDLYNHLEDLRQVSIYLLKLFEKIFFTRVKLSFLCTGWAEKNVTPSAVTHMGRG